MFICDPYGDWEKEWTVANPTPDIEFESGQDGLLHAPMDQVSSRIDWHDRRWIAYRKYCDEHGWPTDMRL